MNKKLTSADYLLLLLYLNEKKPIDGSVRLMKMMFLFEKEIMPILKKKNITIENPPQFFAYDFGPFSKDLNEQIELFKNITFVRVGIIAAQEESDEFDDWEEFHDDAEAVYRTLNVDYQSVSYEILDLGKKYVEQKILNQVDEDVINLLSAFKNKITSISTSKLLYYVYSRYDAYTTKSKIKNKVLGVEIVMPDDALFDPSEGKDE